MYYDDPWHWIPHGQAGMMPERAGKNRKASEKAEGISGSRVEYDGVAEGKEQDGVMKRESAAGWRKSMKRCRYYLGFAVAGTAAGLYLLWGICGAMAGWKMVQSAGVLWPVSVAVLALAGAGVWWSFRAFARQVDHGEDVLADMVECSRRESIAPEKYQQWQDKLKDRMYPGSLGRLYERIWENASVLRQREQDHKRERDYQKDMMTDISHQIKTPLAALQVFLDIFQKEFAGQEQKATMQNMVQSAMDQVARINWLVMGLLKLTQIESGVLPWNPVRTDLSVLIRECAQVLAVNGAQKQIRFVCEGEDGVTFLAEREWLSQAFLNLMKNAMEHAPAGTEVLVQWQETPGSIRVAVTDRGPGIAPEEMPKIFNRFYRGNGQREQSGVGIGLALAKSIVQRHGGTLVVESSQAEPSYTKFVATFLK